ncbi:hypothetical protein Egran_06888 [Elaphomyces granulatus]|uniref:Uncharacterized protein n=1 Tax=Elaphomyces granulatus TaxID=519963 RepID=A0A232LML7_9EURO|nr:hypothetical protein Egran_06888 [Elaphomyces granulatus]
MVHWQLPRDCKCQIREYETIRDILFPYENGLFIGTPPDPEKLYGPTIKAFDDAIAKMKAGETETSP